MLDGTVLGRPAFVLSLSMNLKPCLSNGLDHLFRTSWLSEETAVANHCQPEGARARFLANSSFLRTV